MKPSRKAPIPLAALTIANADPDIWELRLYVAGRARRSMAALENLERLCEKHLAGRRQMQLLADADEEIDAELVLKLADARRHVGLHAVELLRRAGDAAGLHHGAEYVEVG